MFEKEIKELQELIKAKSEERNRVLVQEPASLTEADYLQGVMTGVSYALAMLEKKKLDYERTGIEYLIKVGLNSKYGREAAEEAEKNDYVFQPGFLEEFEKESKK